MQTNTLQLNIIQAERLASLPLKGIQQQYPYQPGFVITSDQKMLTPKEYHPAFYGCYDWHSAVHGHWSLVYLLKHFPDLQQEPTILKIVAEHLTKANIEKEMAYFSLNAHTQNFERTYGWAWLLKLTEELYTWQISNKHIHHKEWAAKLYTNLQPFAQFLMDKYIAYLPKLTYSVRTGTHSNTAFGMTFAWDYAQHIQYNPLLECIEKQAIHFYQNDVDCPIAWEPSGYDFFSASLEEADLMQRILPKQKFIDWFEDFAPILASNTNKNILEVATIKDRSDGLLVHLDGLNFSRAWCLYNIANHSQEWEHLNKIADEHLAYSLPNIVDGDYAGEHWLATFALYALDRKKAASTTQTENGKDGLFV